MIKGIIFDMDGLMFDTERLSTEAWVEIGRRNQFSITPSFMDKMKGRTVQDCVPLFKKEFGDSFDYWKLRMERIAYMEEMIKCEGVPIKKGLHELLNWLMEHDYAIALATSTGRETAINYLRMAEVEDYFSALVFGDMVDHGKPEPDIFLKAAMKLGLPPEQCLVLEDSYAGVEAGWRAQCSVIMIPDTLPCTDREECKVILVAESLLDVISYLEKNDYNRSEKNERSKDNRNW